jgi:uncharacterized Zn finger protein
MTYLLFAWAPSGYELREQEGDPPKVGDSIEVDGRRVWITKLAVSPLPSDQRPCVYSMG